MHPLLSSVLYLSNTGGPTLVLDQTPQQQVLVQRGWLAHPAPGALLAVPGNLLHGVLPGEVGARGRGTGGRRRSWVGRWRTGPPKVPSCEGGDEGVQ